MLKRSIDDDLHRKERVQKKHKKKRMLDEYGIIINIKVF